MASSLYNGPVPASLYHATVRMFVKTLRILSVILKKGRIHAVRNEASLIEARLIAEMAPLTFQIQRLGDTVKTIAVWVGGAEDVVMEGSEKTFDDLQERIKKTIAFAQPLNPDSMNGKEDAKM